MSFGTALGLIPVSTVQNAARKTHLGCLGATLTTPKPTSEEPLVAEEGVLGAGLAVIARLLLPLASSDLAYASNGGIPRSTRGRVCSGLHGRLRRRKHDHRTPRGEPPVDGPLVVRTVPGEALNIDLNLVEEIVDSADIVGATVSHCFGNNDAALFDADVELAPAANALAAVLRGRPLALADDLEAGTVDDQVDWARADSGPQHDRKCPRASQYCCMVGRAATVGG